MNQNDIYYNEVFEANHETIISHMNGLLRQMAVRPLGLYYIKQWPVFNANYDAEEDRTIARLQARATFINIPIVDPQAPFNVSLTMEDVLHVIRERTRLDQDIPEPTDTGVLPRARLQLQGWRRTFKAFLHRCGERYTRWRARNRPEPTTATPVEGPAIQIITARELNWVIDQLEEAEIPLPERIAHGHDRLLIALKHYRKLRETLND